MILCFSKTDLVNWISFFLHVLTLIYVLFHSITLCYIIWQYHTILHCIMLQYITLYFIYITLYLIYSTLYYNIALNFCVLHYTAWYYIMLHYLTLYYNITLWYIILHMLLHIRLHYIHSVSYITDVCTVEHCISTCIYVRTPQRLNPGRTRGGLHPFHGTRQGHRLVWKCVILWFNVGIAIMNHPWLGMVYTLHFWWFRGWFITAIPTNLIMVYWLYIRYHVIYILSDIILSIIYQMFEIIGLHYNVGITMP